jgi:hypothetical protein
MEHPETHVIVTAPGHFFDDEDDVQPEAGDVFGAVTVIGPFPSRTAACEYADKKLDGATWRVDSIPIPAVA